jgi:hypothetical protein
MAWGCDWPYPRSIGGGGSAEEVNGERRRRSRGGTAAEARTAVRIGTELDNVLPWYLLGVLGVVLDGSLGLENRRRGELGDDRPAAAAGTRIPGNCR